ncbi:MAG: HAD family hydrolase [Phycisphaerae bacterium]
MDLDGVFLDFYGTLTTGDRDAVEAVCRDVVGETGISMPPRDLSIRWGECFFRFLDSCNGDGFLTLFEIEVRTLRDTMAALGVEVDPYPHAHRLREYWRAPPLQPEAKRFLTGFHLPVCIVSNADRADAEAAVDVHGLPIAHLVTSEDARSYKPDPRIFETALRQTGWRRDRVIHVGDSLHSDIGGALAAGIRGGWLNRQGRIHDIGTHEPAHEFATLDDLAALLNGT